MVGLQRQEQKAYTKRCIIEVAIQLFARDGLTTARTSDIASTAKVSHGTVFAHFPTRDLLVEAAIEEVGERITSRLHELISEKRGIKEVLEAHLKGIIEYEAFYTSLVLESRMLNENTRNSLLGIQSLVSFHIEQAVENDRKSLKIKSIPMDLIFNTWIGLIHHYLVNADLFAPNSLVIERYGKQLIEHYIKLITQ